MELPRRSRGDELLKPGELTALRARLLRAVADRGLREEYRRRIGRVMRARRDGGVVLFYVLKCAMHYHSHTMARQMASGSARLVNSF